MAPDPDERSAIESTGITSNTFTKYGKIFTVAWLAGTSIETNYSNSELEIKIGAFAATWITNTSTWILTTSQGQLRFQLG